MTLSPVFVTSGIAVQGSDRRVMSSSDRRWSSPASVLRIMPAAWLQHGGWRCCLDNVPANVAPSMHITANVHGR